MNLQHSVVTTAGKPTHVIVPIDEYMAKFSGADIAPAGYVFVPLEVSERVLEGASPMLAWRRHKNLTQEEMARRMGVTRPAYAQMEKSAKPHSATLEKAAVAFGIEAPQLADLYDEPED